MRRLPSFFSRLFLPFVAACLSQGCGVDFQFEAASEIAAVQRPKFGDRKFVRSMFFNLFGTTPTDPQINNLLSFIDASFWTFGGPCDMYETPTNPGLYAGSCRYYSWTLFSKAPTMTWSTANRSALLVKACHTATWLNASTDVFVQRSLGLPAGLPNDAWYTANNGPPNESQVFAMMKAFYPYYSGTDGGVVIDRLEALGQQARASFPGVLRYPWKAIAQTICSSGHWQQQ